MKLTIDRDADALYLNLDETLAEESREISPGVIFDYNAAGKVVGIEMLHLSKRSDNLNLSSLHFETVGHKHKPTMRTPQELDHVALACDLQAHGLLAGDVGTAVLGFTVQGVSSTIFRR